LPWIACSPSRGNRVHDGVEYAPEGANALTRMRHRLSSPEGRAMYALRKCTPEPVFGIIKSVMRFRQFSLRGLQKVQGEWKLVAMSWNIKRMFALAIT
jgi:hypothetical protein